MGLVDREVMEVLSRISRRDLRRRRLVLGLLHLEGRVHGEVLGRRLLMSQEIRLGKILLGIIHLVELGVEGRLMISLLLMKRLVDLVGRDVLL
jgi:hypothetical protein